MRALRVPLFLSVFLWTVPLGLLPATASAVIPAGERAALIAFYYATGGPDWRASSGWLGLAGSECGWAGVICDGPGTAVLELQLMDNQLSGELPPELGELGRLKFLGLSKNALFGPIPHEIGRLTDLRHLLLAYNQLTASLPPELGDLVNLETLDLTDNLLVGSLPPELGKLHRLVTFYAGRNHLSGMLPPELGDLAELQNLSLDDNLLF